MYTRRENVRIFNVKEEVEENTKEVVRDLLVTKLKIPLEKVKDIRFERVHHIPRKTRNSTILAYGGSQLPVIGQVTPRVWHDIRPILGRKTCIGMNIVQYTDNDAINNRECCSLLSGR